MQRIEARQKESQVWQAVERAITAVEHDPKVIDIIEVDTMCDHAMAKLGLNYESNPTARFLVQTGLRRIVVAQLMGLSQAQFRNRANAEKVDAGLQALLDEMEEMKAAGEANAVVE